MIYIYQIIKHISIFIQLLFFYSLYKLKYVDFNWLIKNSCIKLTKLSYYYIKILQWQLQNKYLSDSDLEDFFKKYTDNVPFSDENIDYKLLDDLELYASNNGYKLNIINRNPIGSGTVAIIWKGYLNDNPIAIKILRKNIENEIKNCFNVIFILSLFYNCFRFRQFYQAIKDNQENMLEQCNFNNEVNNIDLFYNIYKNSELVVIPQVYKEFTNNYKNVIIMDFIDGYKFNQLTNEDKQQFAKAYNYFYNDSIYIKQICHGDLHVGNVVFIKTADNQYKIGVYDFGLVYKLTKLEATLFCKYMIMMINNDKKGIIEALIGFAFVNNDNEKKMKCINILLEKNIFIKGKTSGFNDVSEIFKEALKCNFKITNKNSFAILLSITSSLYLSTNFGINGSIANTFNNFLIDDTIRCD